MNPKLRQQPVADKGANQANDQITDKSETAAFHHSAGEPAGDNANKDDDQDAFVGQAHDVFPRE
jgi:hypothetical protein